MNCGKRVPESVSSASWQIEPATRWKQFEIPAQGVARVITNIGGEGH